MEVDYAPRPKVRDWLGRGWRLVPDHTYRSDDWAVVMVKQAPPTQPILMTDLQMDAEAARFRDPPPPPEDNGRDNRGRWRPRGVCSVPGCSQNNHARGLCVAHYSRWRRAHE